MDRPAGSQIVWTPAGWPLHLPAGAIHLWRLNREITAPSAQTLLSAEEWQRAMSLRHFPAQAAFIATRIALRQILAAYLDVAPYSLRLTMNTQGKPYIAWPTPAIMFNLSHTCGCCVLAISRDLELGVDVEQLRLRSNYLEIAKRIFAAETVTHLSKLPALARHLQFYIDWTHMEARVKAVGGSLFNRAIYNMPGLDAIHFMPAPHIQGCLVARGKLPPVTEWRTLLLQA